MSIIENLSTLKNSNSTLSVTLHQNNLKKDGTYYARVSRNLATFNNIISEIAEENKGLDPHLLQYSAILIQKKILKMLEQGKAVNILDLGTMYISMRCNAKGKSDVPSNGKFCIKFSPTQIAQDTVNALNVDKVVYVDNEPEITTITDLSTNQSDEKLTMGKPAAIFGSRLKLSDSGSGIYFAKVEETGTISNDEQNWILVPKENIFRNKPSELNFFVPDSLENETSYCIVIKSNYLSNNKVRKDFVEVISNPIMIM